jgi:hypothetical protein
MLFYICGYNAHMVLHHAFFNFSSASFFHENVHNVNARTVDRGIYGEKLLSFPFIFLREIYLKFRLFGDFLMGVGEKRIFKLFSYAEKLSK